MSMIKEYKVIILILAFALCFVLNDNAYAANGFRSLGFSARDSAMAGATTASSEDTSCLVKNPAGLVRIGNRVDVDYENIIFHDVTLDTEGPVSLPFPPPFDRYVNAGVKQQSNINYIPAGNAGVSYRVPGTDKYPVSVGCGLFTISGMALNYAAPRLNLNAFGVGSDYDKMIDMRSMRIAPGIAVGFTDKLFFGAAANINIQALRTNMIKTGVFPFEETAGGGDWDFAPGAGFTLGVLYQFNEMLALAASYESHEWMGHHYKYKDVLPYVDEPPIISAGISFKPIKEWEFTYDTRYINWTDVKFLRIAPKDGGLGWRDQWVFAVGSEYTYKDKLKLRIGYDYGRSQIQPNVVFANALTPLIIEHHITTGLSYSITKNLSADLTWEHHFQNSMVDDGGDSTDSIGNGTRVSGAVDIISVGLGYKF